MNIRFWASTIIAIHLWTSFVGLLLVSIYEAVWPLMLPASGLFVSWMHHALVAGSMKHRITASSALRIVLGAVMIVAMMASTALNNVSPESIIKALFGMFFITLFAVLVSSSYRDFGVAETRVKVRVTFIHISLLLIVIAVIWYINDWSTSRRFGEPFSPGVFGIYMVVAFLTSVILNQSKAYQGIFLTFVALSQSRGAVLSLLIGIVILYVSSLRGLARSAAALGTLVIALIIAINIGWDPAFLKEREDVSSGRFRIWSEVLEGIYEAPLIGHGSAPIVTLTSSFGEERDFGAHNSFLDMTYSYGLFYSVSAYLLILVIFFSSLCSLGGWKNQETRYIAAIFTILFLKSLVTNTFWTNMSDAMSIFIMYLLCMSAAQRTSSSSPDF